MTIENAPTPPESLAEEGQSLWVSVCAVYRLRADELRTLEDACTASDMVALFSEKWRELGRPLISKGSMGQEVEHPLIGSIDKQRKARQAFLKQLRLPDEAGGGEMNQNRSAGQSRWAAQHGNGA